MPCCGPKWTSRKGVSSWTRLKNGFVWLHANMPQALRCRSSAPHWGQERSGATSPMLLCFFPLNTSPVHPQQGQNRFGRFSGNLDIISWTGLKFSNTVISSDERVFLGKPESNEAVVDGTLIVENFEAGMLPSITQTERPTMTIGFKQVLYVDRTVLLCCTPTMICLFCW